MLEQILSWVILALGLIAFWVAAKHPWGWFIGLTQQVGYMVFALVTRNWGFIAHSLAFGAVFIRNYIVDSRAAKARLNV